MKLVTPRTAGLLSRAGRFGLAAVAAAAVVLAPAPFPQASALAGTVPVQIFYVPVPEEEFRTYAQAQANLAENDVQTSVISLTATFAGTVIYYDEWEDGYEYDITTPSQSTTQVWGDGDLGNGVAPGFPTDLLTAGNVITLQNDVPVNVNGLGVRDRGVRLYDGRDKIAATEQLVVTHAMWPSSGVAAQLGGAVEAFDTQRWGTSYDVPLGTNIGTPTNGFNWVRLSVMAGEDGTLVEVDADANGSYEISRTLAEGATYFSAVNLLRGARVRSSAPVQVNLLTCQSPSTYNGRLYPLLPTVSWGNFYYTPVPSTQEGGGTNVPAYVILFNPGAAPISVAVTTNGGPGAPIPIASRQTATYTMPQGTAASFQSAGTFYAVEAIDNGNVHNWGFTLLPRESLTTSVVAGWSPGTTDLARDASPLWVTPDAATTIYVDYDGDPTTGPGTVTVPGLPADVHYDASYPIAALESRRLFSATNDHTGWRIFTVDKTRIAVVWGQDGANSSSGQPTELDLGTTLIPYPTLTAYKAAALIGDFNGNGGIDPGEVLRYTIRVYNSGIVPLETIQLEDVLDLAKMTYIANTSVVAGAPIADAAAGTRFPFDEGGYALPVAGGFLLPGEEIVVSFEVTVSTGASGSLVNQARATSISEIFLNAVSAVVEPGALQTTKASSAPALGRDLRPGDRVDYTVTVTNVGTANQTGISVTDPLPVGSTYVAGSTLATGFREKLVRDVFDRIAYSNNDGPEPWAGNWLESDGTQSPTAGNVRVSDGELRLAAAGSWARRVVDLSGFAGGAATLSLSWRTSPFVTATDAAVVEASTNGAAWTTLGTITGVAGPQSGTRSYDVSGFIAATTYVRLRLTAGYAAPRYFYADRVEVRASGASATLASDTFASGGFAGGSGWLAAWTENDAKGLGAGSGNLQVIAQELSFELRDSGDSLRRSADLSTASGPVRLSLTFRTGALEADDAVLVEISTDATNWTLLENLTGIVGSQGPFARSYDITAWRSAGTWVRLRNVSGSGNNDFFFFDNVAITTPVHLPLAKDSVAGGAIADLADGTPALLVQPQDGFALAPGEQMTVVYAVTVNTPASVTRLVNTATVTSWEKAPPSSATTVDPVSEGGAIGDLVWLDTDQDGLLDIGEQGLVNARVWLDTNGNGAFDAGTDLETLTSSRGTYSFSSLPPGTYRAYLDTATIPAGLVLSGAATNPSAPLVVTDANEVFTDVDFGYRPAAGTAALGNLLWSDADDDGVQDVGEVGINGVRMALATGPGGDGVWYTADDAIVAWTLTGPDGTYLFTNVPAGTWYVIADVGADGLPDTGDEALGSYTPSIGPQSAGAYVSWPVPILADQIKTDSDFGFHDPNLVSVTDRLWFDTDGDGTLDPGEPGIPGVTVNLLNPGVFVKGTSVTDASGRFTFSGVPDGFQTLSVEDADGVLSAFSGTTAAAQAGTYALTVAGSDVSGVHFGYNAPGSIGDRVWSDADGDGTPDPGEPGIPGVSVELYFDTNGNGLLDLGTDALVAATTTDAAGRYLFTVQQAGRYFASVPVQAALGGYSLTTGDDDPAATGDQSRVDLYNLLTSHLSADFGYRNPSYHAVAGFVFDDADSDGSFANPPEVGLAGVTLDLLDAGGTVFATTTSAADGSYAFPGLPDGSYTVRVTDTNGVLDTWTVTTGGTEQAVALSGADLSGVNFGFFKPPTLVHLTGIEAVATPAGPVVTWETSAERGTAGFLLYRVDGSGEVPVTAGLVPASPGGSSGGRYAVLDAGGRGPRPTYRLEEVRRRGAPLSYGPFTLRVRPAADGDLLPAEGRSHARAPHPAASGAPAVARTARPAPDALGTPAAPAAPAAGTHVRIGITADGIYRVRASEIAPLLGLTARRASRLIASNRLALTSGGRRVAYLPVGRGAALLFRGRALDTPYTAENVYWLTPGSGLTMARADGAPDPGSALRTVFVDTARAEEETFADTYSATDPAADYWFWDWLVADDPADGSRTHTVAVPGATGTGTATVVAHLRGATETGLDPEHHVLLRVGGTTVGEVTWAGLGTAAAVATIDAAALAGGSLAVELAAVLDAGVPYSVVNLDSIEISYRRSTAAAGDLLLVRGGRGTAVTVRGFTSPAIRVFDLSRPNRPRLLSGVRVSGGPGFWRATFRSASAATPYLAVAAPAVARPASLRAWSDTGLSGSANAAEYVVIAPEAFAAAAAPLAAYRAGQGLAARVVTVEAVMDEFNDGVFDPEGLRAFLARARSAWAVPPRLVLLAGDGGFDCRDRLGHGDCLVPPLMTPTPYGLFASDARLADLDGDRLPDLGLGRIPARSDRELEAAIAKTVAAEAGGGTWRSSVVFSADRPDPAGDFEADSDAMLELVPAGESRTRVYLDEQPNVAAARAAFRAAIEGGAGYVNYLGHAGPDFLAQEGLFLASEAEGLAAAGRLPVFGIYSCLAGDFATPGGNGVGEALLRAPNGAVAVFGPTGEALNDRSVALGSALLGLRYALPGARLGILAQEAMRAYGAARGADGTLDIYGILGDPALVLP